MQAAKYSLKALKDIGKISNDGVLVYDLPKDKIEYCNQSLSEMFGLRKEDLVGESRPRLTKLLGEDVGFLEKQLKILKSESRISNVELKLYNGGTDRQISCDAWLINDSKTVVVFIKDITKSKEHFNYLVDFGARKDAVLEMLAHNLTGPLNLTNNLLDLVDQSNQAQRYRKIDDYSHLIRENTQHCIEIINSFLAEEHLTSKDIFVESNRFDAIEKVNVVVERFRPFRPEKNIQVLTNSNRLFVTGDDVKFAQIVQNLISNSMKFTADAGKIIVRIEEFQNSFRLTVQDDGIGIPEYLHPHLFKKNTPAARPGLKGEKSTGIGLYAVKKLTHLMKGKVSFESREGEGTTFTLDFPKS